MEIHYPGEHLLPGSIGHFFVILAFVSCLFSVWSFYRMDKDPADRSWIRLSGSFYYTHVIAIIGIIASLFYIIFNHYYEYAYAYNHSSDDLPLRYIFSCFWEGQEGSFLLWAFWNSMLGLVLLSFNKYQLPAVMAVFCSVQVFILSMLLGVFPFGIQIGSDPFTLLRENPEMASAPIFTNVNYTSLINGTGLNPLLQNYWMTIHPPTLFLGFASVHIPFAFALASLWKKDYSGWLQPALPWFLFGVMILGTGILMGGAWAYEALSFGGFWAWDPVENASLVPWMVLVAAMHLAIINWRRKKQPTSLFSTYLLTILSFILILYSTYLTRSGILGETSVHSFADGLPGQLIVMLVFFIVMVSVFLIFHYKKIKQVSQKDEENSSSREFWMFIASMVLFVASFQIIVSTSLPVINAIFGTNYAQPEDVIDHYHSWQIPFAVIITFLMAIAQFFNYKKTSRATFTKKISWSFVLAFILSAILVFVLKFEHFFLNLLLFTSIFALFANSDYLWRILKGKIKNGGASVSHAGFALLILGALISTGKTDIISVNTSGVDINMKGEGNVNQKNILLAMNDTLPMGDYQVVYEGSEKKGINIYYTVTYLKETASGLETAFTLNPRIQTNKLMGNVPEPDTRHFWNKDIFTHITYADLERFEKKDDDTYLPGDTLELSSGDSTFSSACIIEIGDLIKDIDKSELGLNDDDLAIGVNIKALHKDSRIQEVMPVLVIRGNELFSMLTEIEEFGLRFTFARLNPSTGKIKLIVEEKKNNGNDFIIMQAMIFPFINLLWTGCIIMVLGILLSIYSRIQRTNS